MKKMPDTWYKRDSLFGFRQMISHANKVSLFVFDIHLLPVTSDRGVVFIYYDRNEWNYHANLGIFMFVIKILRSSAHILSLVISGH